MQALLNLWDSTIGKKIVMAVTGLIIFGFVIGHMAGNLLIFLGAEVFNDYAHTLKSNALLLWGTRLTLLAVIPLHVLSAIQVVKRNAGAREGSYGATNYQRSTVASRFMRFGGLLLLGFILLHLAHYTLYLTHPHFEGMEPYAMVMLGFSDPVYVGIYLLAMVCLFLHLDHGAWSLLQTLGLFARPDQQEGRKKFARTFAAVLFIGFSSVPIAVLTGLVS
jgi:succinate dehydrogenase / fumarate reductase, cytochrome b subunit